MSNFSKFSAEIRVPRFPVIEKSTIDEILEDFASDPQIFIDNGLLDLSKNPRPIDGKLKLGPNPHLVDMLALNCLGLRLASSKKKV